MRVASTCYLRWGAPMPQSARLLSCMSISATTIFLQSAPIAGKLLVIWDGSPIHRSKAVKEFLNDGAASRLQLEQLPGYAPELNPDEGIWKHLKGVELKNLCCQNLYELRSELCKAKERLRHKRHIILGCIRQPGLETEASAKRQVLPHE